MCLNVGIYSLCLFLLSVYSISLTFERVEDKIITGSPEITKQVAESVSEVNTTIDWGFGHGNWPMLMHLFPDADVPVFQLSLVDSLRLSISLRY